MSAPIEATAGAATATFLMTDIEGSTRLWEEHPDVMAVVLERHDATLHGVVDEHHGTVFKTTGDGMLAAFADPVAAVLAAIDGQRRLEPLAREPVTPVRVRMALHTGGAQVRDGDYFGPALNRVARLLAIGHGGQVLLSGVTAALTRDRLGPDVGLIDRGDHLLRDLVQPEHVHQLLAPGLARDFPPLRSLAGREGDLPIQMTSFVGRDRELADVGRLIGTHRMVTLIGTGGTGKTRLMIEGARSLIGGFREGIRLAELAPISDPDLIAPEVLRAVGGRDQPGSASIDTLVDHLRYKQLLLLLDNCEHLIGAAADVAYRLLTNCPDVTIIATSREALAIDGETIYQVPSLGLARGGHDEDPHTDAAPDRYAEIAAAGAVRLFVDRASAVVPGFELTRQNAPTIAEICERLDGIPLAIELAAARVAVLSVDDILRRLGDRFRLLTGGRRTAVPRQQTLQALVDWSWDLLAEPDRLLLRRLSVFAGGWTLDAAAAVGRGTDSDTDTSETLDALERLVERSLMVVDRTGPMTRFRFLETIRQYARDRLTESGEADTARGAHLAYFSAIVEAETARMKGPELGDALARIDPEIDNIRAAIEWGLEADPEVAGRLCAAMWMYWRSRLTGGEAADWLTAAVERVRALDPIDDPTATRERMILLSRLLSSTAFARATMTTEPAIVLAEESVAIARAVGDDDALAQGLSALWTARWFTGREGLAEVADRSLEVSARLGDLWLLSFAEGSAAANTIQAHDPARARALLDSALTHARATGNPFAIAFAAMNRGRVLGALGDLDAARPAFDEAFAAYSAIGDDRFALATRSDLGHALRVNGRPDEAEVVYRSTIHEWERFGHRGAIANQLESFAYLAIGRDSLPRAARLLGAAEALREASAETMAAFEREPYAAAIDDLRSRLDASALATEWAIGRSLSMPAAVDLAIATDAVAEANPPVST